MEEQKALLQEPFTPAVACFPSRCLQLQGAISLSSYAQKSSAERQQCRRTHSPNQTARLYWVCAQVDP
jgi:hypothetical protein